MIGRMGRSTAVSEKRHTRKSKVQGLLALLRRLQDPKDVQAAAFMAFAILVFEAGICPLIIAKIPCKSPPFPCLYLVIAICVVEPFSLDVLSDTPGSLAVCHADTELDWVAYMQEVEGFMKVSPITYIANA